MPSYESPSAPTSPLDHGWRTIQSTSSAPSRTSSSDQSERCTPPDAPEPRTSTSSHA